VSEYEEPRCDARDVLFKDDIRRGKLDVVAEVFSGYAMISS